MELALGCTGNGGWHCAGSAPQIHAHWLPLDGNLTTLSMSNNKIKGTVSCGAALLMGINACHLLQHVRLVLSTGPAAA